MRSNKKSSSWRCGIDATVDVPYDVYEALEGAGDSVEAQRKIIDAWDQAAHKARTTSIVA